MCPSYKVSRDELHTPRARANVIREYLLATKNNPSADPHLSPSNVQEVLQSCLACKACKRECPSGVDMTRLRAEVLQALYEREGTPLHTWMVAHNADVQRLGALMPPVYNFFATNRFTSSLLKRLVGFAPERNIPRISSISVSALSAQRGPQRASLEWGALQRSNSASGLSAKRSVYLFIDEFTRYQEPELLDTFIRLADKLGYRVIIPRHVESGRAAISKGCLKLAKKYAEKNVRLLQDLITSETPLVGIEPSCILTFRDEYPHLVPPELHEAAERLAENTLLYDEWLMREVEAGHITTGQFSDLKADIWLHGHCHQKALVGVEKTAALLDLPKNTTVHVIPSSCCGMAGSFGYEKEHYKTSLAIGEMVLFPAVRQAFNQQSAISGQQSAISGQPSADSGLTLIAAPGISCRTQIHDGTGYTAHHPIEILCKLLKNE